MNGMCAMHLPKNNLPACEVLDIATVFLCCCNLLSFCLFVQAHYCLSGCNTDSRYVKKNLLFIKWKYLEAKVMITITFLLYNFYTSTFLAPSISNVAESDNLFCILRLQLTTTMARSLTRVLNHPVM